MLLPLLLLGGALLLVLRKSASPDFSSQEEAVAYAAHAPPGTVVRWRRGSESGSVTATYGSREYPFPTEAQAVAYAHEYPGRSVVWADRLGSGSVMAEPPPFVTQWAPADPNAPPPHTIR